MKKFIVLAIFALSTTAFASFEYKSFSLNFSGNSEAEVMSKVESAIPGIKNATNKKVRRDLTSENCWPLKSRYIEIDSLSISKSYKYENGEMITKYTGRLLYWHSNCQDGGN